MTTQASPKIAPPGMPEWLPRIGTPDIDADRQRAAWTTTLRRSESVARWISAEFGEPEGLRNVQAMPTGHVIAGVHITDLRQWVFWCDYLSITEDRVSDIGYAAVGDGHRDGVPVSLVAQDLPAVLARAEQSATRPYRYAGEVYDLSVPFRDMTGVVWYHHGETAEGMPLLSVDGRAERCSLAQVVEFNGPLTPVMAPVTGVIAEAGEAA